MNKWDCVGKKLYKEVFTVIWFIVRELTSKVKDIYDFGNRMLITEYKNSYFVIPISLFDFLYL